MPPVLATKLSREHALELVALENDEIDRLRKLYEQARLEIHGRLSQLGVETFTAQHYRSTLAQVESGLASMIERLEGNQSRVLVRSLRRSVRQTLAEIAQFEPTFQGGASGAIAIGAVKALSRHEGLLLQRFETSIGTYGQTLIGDIQRRLGVHIVKRSFYRDVVTDIAGRLEQHAVRGARWRAERIVRTELVHALNVGHQGALEASARLLPDLKRQWDATLDARTSDICLALNGQVKGLHEPFVYQGREIAHPPSHPNCRSTVHGWRATWFDSEGVAQPAPVPPPKPTPSPQRLRELKLERGVRAAEDEIRGDAVETAITFNDDGSVFFRKRGNRNSVIFEHAELESLRGRVFTHNHPSSGSFSPQDVFLTAVWGIAEMRVTSRLWDYSIRPRKGRPWDEAYWQNDIEPTMREVNQQVYAELRPQVDRGDLSVDGATVLHWHLVWQRVSRRLGLRYSRRKARR